MCSSSCKHVVRFCTHAPHETTVKSATLVNWMRDKSRIGTRFGSHAHAHAHALSRSAPAPPLPLACAVHLDRFAWPRALSLVAQTALAAHARHAHAHIRPDAAKCLVYQPPNLLHLGDLDGVNTMYSRLSVPSLDMRLLPLSKSKAEREAEADADRDEPLKVDGDDEVFPRKMKIKLKSSLLKVLFNSGVASHHNCRYERGRCLPTRRGTPIYNLNQSQPVAAPQPRPD